MEVCSARTPQTACAPPQSINININTASHLKVTLGWSHIQNIIRDHDTFLMRSTAEWMHCLAVVICKIQSSYSTKSYFQSDERLAGPNGWCLKPLGFLFYAELREKGPHLLLYQGTDSHHTFVALLFRSRSSWQITIITVSPHRCILLTHIIQTTEVFDTLPNHHIHPLSSLAWSLSLSCVCCTWLHHASSIVVRWLQCSGTQNWACIMHLWIIYSKTS